MDRSSFFIDDKALFGSFPTQNSVEELEEFGVRHFINLTHDHESKITPYSTKYNYLQYSIHDRVAPTDYISFARFLVKVANIIQNLDEGEYIYIHCKGGHGRSGVVVACLLVIMFNLSPKEALKRTTDTHFKRKIMRERWRRLGSPQTKIQKSFVYHFFEDIRIYPFYFEGHWSLLSDRFELPFQYEGKTYKSVSEAFEELRKDIRDIVTMKKLMKERFNTNVVMKNKLLSTGFKHITYHSHDPYWGIGKEPDGGLNIFGQMLMEIRKALIVN